mmetsp:Transcript_15983/g.53528  ORF Transcript_15983/g.53528 Transcript_15983/m.53528 type:complete len:285 (-) Transcript_15983:2191-3045(-)
MHVGSHGDDDVVRLRLGEVLLEAQVQQDLLARRLLGSEGDADLGRRVSCHDRLLLVRQRALPLLVALLLLRPRQVLHQTTLPRPLPQLPDLDRAGQRPPVYQHDLPVHHLPQHCVQLDLRSGGGDVDLLGVAAEGDVLRAGLAEEGDGLFDVLVDLGLEADQQVTRHARRERPRVVVRDDEEVLDRVRELQQLERVERERRVSQGDLLLVRLPRLEVDKLHRRHVSPLLRGHERRPLELSPPDHLLLDPPVPFLLPLHCLLQVLLLQLRQAVPPPPLLVYCHTL